jgi:pyridoxine 4-dehydrogenase
VDIRPAARQLAEPVALRAEGKIAGVGLSNATLEQVETAIDVADNTCVQDPVSVLDRHDTPVLDRCLREGIAYVPCFPLGSAVSSSPTARRTPA